MKIKLCRFISLFRAEIPFFIGVFAIIWQLLFLFLPLAKVLIGAIIEQPVSEKISSIWEKIAFFSTPYYLRIVASSFLLALSNSIICFILAYPLAYFLVYHAKKIKTLLLFLLMVPFWTNFFLHIYAWFYLLEKNGLINTLLIRWGVIGSSLPLLNTIWAIMIMMVYYYLPFMLLPIYSSLAHFNSNLIEASFNLGASWFTTLRRIILPLTIPGIRVGFFLVYIPSFGEFAIPSLMGGDKYAFVGSIISDFVLAEGTESLGITFMFITSLLLLFTVGLFYWIFQLFSKKKRSKERG